MAWRLKVASLRGDKQRHSNKFALSSGGYCGYGRIDSSIKSACQMHGNLEILFGSLKHRGDHLHLTLIGKTKRR
jgi:hypothetical protein